MRMLVKSLRRGNKAICAIVACCSLLVLPDALAGKKYPAGRSPSKQEQEEVLARAGVRIVQLPATLVDYVSTVPNISATSPADPSFPPFEVPTIFRGMRWTDLGESESPSVPSVTQGSTAIAPTALPELDTPILSSSFESVTFDGNAVNTGFYQIPPDPHLAAGLTSLVSLVNSTIRFHSKTGTMTFESSLDGFFGGAPLSTGFDPKVIYDKYSKKGAKTEIGPVSGYCPHMKRFVVV